MDSARPSWLVVLVDALRRVIHLSLGFEERRAIIVHKLDAHTANLLDDPQSNTWLAISCCLHRTMKKSTLRCNCDATVGAAIEEQLSRWKLVGFYRNESVSMLGGMLRRAKGGQLCVECGWKLCNCFSIRQGDKWKDCVVRILLRFGRMRKHQQVQGRSRENRGGRGDEPLNELWGQVFLAYTERGRVKPVASILLPSPSKPLFGDFTLFLDDCESLQVLFNCLLWISSLSDFPQLYVIFSLATKFGQEVSIPCILSFCMIIYPLIGFLIWS